MSQLFRVSTYGGQSGTNDRILQKFCAFSSDLSLQPHQPSRCLAKMASGATSASQSRARINKDQYTGFTICTFGVAQPI